jgi:hypothetical protein
MRATSSAKENEQALASLDRALRQAIAQGLFRDAEELLMRYCGRLEAGLAELGGTERARLLGNSLELLEHIRRSALAARSHIAHRLSEIGTVIPYVSTSVQHSWEVEG